MNTYLELRVARLRKECRAWADYCFVEVVKLVMANDLEIRIFAVLREPSVKVLDGGTYSVARLEE